MQVPPGAPKLCMSKLLVNHGLPREQGTPQRSRSVGVIVQSRTSTHSCTENGRALALGQRPRLKKEDQIVCKYQSTGVPIKSAQKGAALCFGAAQPHCELTIATQNHSQKRNRNPVPRTRTIQTKSCTGGKRHHVEKAEKLAPIAISLSLSPVIRLAGESLQLMRPDTDKSKAFSHIRFTHRSFKICSQKLNF